MRETIRSRKHFATITDQKFINSLSGLFLFAYARHMRGTAAGRGILTGLLLAPLLFIELGIRALHNR